MAHPSPPGENQHLAIFRVASYTFCAPAHTVSAITDVPAWTRIPKTPPSILGAVNHRGQVVVVVSLRRKLGLEPEPANIRSQLIIAELDTGLTGFKVDAVEDVRRPSDMQRHPLATGAAIDIFDAYLVDGDRILLQTDFQKLYDARETPPRAVDLEAHLRQAEEKLTVSDRSTAAAEAPAKTTETAAESVSVPGPAPAAAKISSGARGVPDATPPPGPSQGTPPPAGEAPPPAAEKPPLDRGLRAETPWPTGRQPGAARPSWYRYAFVAALFLVMTVALGAGVWLLRQQTGMRTRGDIPMSARPVTAAPEAVPAATVRERSAQNTPPETGEEKSSPEEKPQPPAMTPAPSPGTAEIVPPVPEGSQPTADSQVSAVSNRRATPVPHAEVLRIETETFTLTVERPSRADAATPDKPPGETPTETAEEIRHIVVRGDTLWDIAAHYLGDPFQYPELARLSRIRDPDLIYPNDVIRIVRRPSQNAAP